MSEKIARLLESNLLTKACKDANGRYINPWDTWSNEIFSPMRFLSFATFKGGEAGYKPTASDIEVMKNLPICEPKFKFDGELLTDHIRMTWIGHASVLFYIEGFNIICDPIFSRRCSPTQLAFGSLRYRPVPCSVEELPSIDAVLISHNHYDHLDMLTVAKIAHFHPQSQWCVPQGDGAAISAQLNKNMPKGCKPLVKEFEWWNTLSMDKICASDQLRKLELIFTPAQHWSGRQIITDKCQSLWGSWAIIGQNKRCWFGGDTGYCTVFKEIGEHFGPFDLSAIPIGAFIPRDYLKFQHVNPKEAVMIHTDIRSRHSVGVHWGTFSLAYESYMRPQNDLKEAVAEAGLAPQEFETIQHGQSFCIDDVVSADAGNVTEERVYIE